MRGRSKAVYVAYREFLREAHKLFRREETRIPLVTLRSETRKVIKMLPDVWLSYFIFSLVDCVGDGDIIFIDASI